MAGISPLIARDGGAVVVLRRGWESVQALDRTTQGHTVEPQPKAKETFQYFNAYFVFWDRKAKFNSTVIIFIVSCFMVW